jgi:hypothetical protein
LMKLCSEGKKTLRHQISLDGSWQFQIDPAGTLTLSDINEWRTIQVPAPWQAQLDDLRLVAGVGWYRRQVFVSEAWSDHSVFLKIGAADYFTEVWINGHLVGQHEGGYLPFEFDVTSYLSFGADNDVVIRVTDPGPHEQDIFPPFPFAEIPHGKQSWYGPVGGIWQSVGLEMRAHSHIGQIRVTPQGLSGVVSVEVNLVNTPERGQLRARCFAPGDQPVAEIYKRVVPGVSNIPIDFTIDQPALWEPDSPTLYTLDVILEGEDQPVDRQTVRFGIRTIETRDGKLWLNGRLLYLRGALDQDYYPEGIYTPPSLDFLRAQVRQAKAMGLNCLRCHIKIPDPRYLQAADEEGILIWAEVPSWGRLTEKSGQRVRDTFAGMVARDWNHPSIVIWTLVNENWGTDLIHSARDRQWLSETVDWARQLDPTRLIVDNSACFFNFHVKTDIEDFHFYAAMPENMDKWQQFVNHFAERAPFTFSPNGDSIRTSQEPLVLSEFGNWGLPDIARLRKAYGQRDPWWFDTGQERDSPVVWPGDAEARLFETGLGNVFGDWAGLAEAAQMAEYRALKYEIETMRAEQALSGYVITEWSDLHWECNGLVDMARNPRIFVEDLAAINSDTVIVPRWETLAYWAGDTLHTDILVSHYGLAAHQDVMVHWSLAGSEHKGTLPPISLEPGRVVRAGSVSFDVPHTSNQASVRNLTLELTLPDGRTIARNHLPITSFDRALQPAPEGAGVWSDDEALRAWLSSHRYKLDEPGGLWIVRRLSENAQRYLEHGGHVLLCTAESGEITSGIRVGARQDTPWSGDWASSFAWVRPGVTRIPGGPLLDFSWRGVFPEHVVTGIAPDHTFAGLFVGWIHMPAALIGRAPSGQGQLTITTFPVLAADTSPIRTVLLHDLIRLAQKR